MRVRGRQSRLAAVLLRAAAVFSVAGLPAAVALSAGSTSAAAANVVVVRMHEFMFCADTACTQDSSSGGVVTIHTGDVVKWVWDESSLDPMPNCDSIVLQLPIPVNCPGHTSTATAKAPGGAPLWDSGTCAAPDGHAAPGSAGCPYSVTFNNPGSFSYFCVYHGGANPNNPLTKMNGVVVVQGQPLSGSGTATTGSGVNGATASHSPVPALPNTGAGGAALVSRFRDVLLVGGVIYLLTALGAGLALAPRR